MKMECGETKPLSDFVEPAIEFPLKIKCNSFESLLSIEGTMLAEDGKILAGMSEKIENHGREVGKISARGSGRDKGLEIEESVDISLVALLSKGAINHIDDVRDRNRKRNVAFTLQLRVRILKSKAHIAHVHEITPGEIGPPIRGTLENIGVESLISYKSQQGYSGPRNDLWLISGGSEPIFLEIWDMPAQIPIEIAASDWVQDFAPKLGIGRFVIAELPLPSPAAVGDEFAKRLNEAIKALSEMEEKVKEGEWNEVIEKSRPVFELLRYENMIKTILSKHGYSQEAADNLFSAIGGLFDYSSKFLHKLDRDRRTIPPEINAEKEDAYLVYTLSVTLVNLLTQKVRKSGNL